MNNFLIKDTTPSQRQLLVNDALAISLLDAGKPSPETMEFATQYVDGKIDPSEVRKKIIELYSDPV